MTTRTLPRADWPRLVGTELEHVWPLLPAGAEITVVEADGQIVGAWALVSYLHVEGVWVHPDHQKRGSVAKRLIVGMRRLLQQRGMGRAITTACSPEVERLIRHLDGIELPGRHFAISLERV